jgi:hypothetical protein
VTEHIEADSWIEIPPSLSDESDAEIITSGLRIRRRRRVHQNLAETIFVEDPTPMTISVSSLSSEGDSEEGEDMAGYLASMPLSSSGFTTDDENSTSSDDDEGDEDDSETVLDNPALNAKARLELEHDAALRASLSTLLSCAAAARGLPPRRAGGVEGLRVVQGSTPPPAATVSVSSEGSGRSVSRRRKREKAREEREKVVRRTMMTLAVTAGAVVVLSVLSFSAGYLVRRFEGGGVVSEARRVRVRVA